MIRVQRNSRRLSELGSFGDWPCLVARRNFTANEHGKLLLNETDGHQRRGREPRENHVQEALFALAQTRR